MTFEAKFSLPQRYWDNHCTSTARLETVSQDLCVNDCEVCITPKRAQPAPNCGNQLKNWPSYFNVVFSGQFGDCMTDPAADYTFDSSHPWGSAFTCRDLTVFPGKPSPHVTLVNPAYHYQTIWDRLFAAGCIDQDRYLDPMADRTHCFWVNDSRVLVGDWWCPPYATTLSSFNWQAQPGAAFCAPGGSNINAFDGNVPVGVVGFDRQVLTWAPPEDVRNSFNDFRYLPGLPSGCGNGWAWGRAFNDGMLADALGYSCDKFFRLGPLLNGEWPSLGVQAGAVPTTAGTLARYSNLPGKISLLGGGAVGNVFSGYRWAFGKAITGVQYYDSNGIATPVLTCSGYYAGQRTTLSVTRAGVPLLIGDSFEDGNWRNAINVPGFGAPGYTNNGSASPCNKILNKVTYHQDSQITYPANPHFQGDGFELLPSYVPPLFNLTDPADPYTTEPTDTYWFHPNAWSSDTAYRDAVNPGVSWDIVSGSVAPWNYGLGTANDLSELIGVWKCDPAPQPGDKVVNLVLVRGPGAAIEPATSVFPRTVPSTGKLYL